MHHHGCGVPVRRSRASRQPSTVRWVSNRSEQTRSAYRCTVRPSDNRFGTNRFRREVSLMRSPGADGSAPGSTQRRAADRGDDRRRRRGLSRFADICIEALGPVAAVIKPHQVAVLRAVRCAGFAVLRTGHRIAAFVARAGAWCSPTPNAATSAPRWPRYSTAWLDDSSQLCADAVTISPYLVSNRCGRPSTSHTSLAGVFVLARTPTPRVVRVQTAHVPDGRTVARRSPTTPPPRTRTAPRPSAWWSALPAHTVSTCPR